MHAWMCGMRGTIETKDKHAGEWNACMDVWNAWRCVLHVQVNTLHLLTCGKTCTVVVM